MNAVFVYGTLMRGERLHSLLQAADPLTILAARTPGLLVDLGEYPGLLPVEPDWTSAASSLRRAPSEPSPSTSRELPPEPEDLHIASGLLPAPSGLVAAPSELLHATSRRRPVTQDDAWVLGEYVEFASLDALLPQLDEVEEYRESEEAASPYLRRTVEVILLDGSRKVAWAYLYNGPYNPARIIPGGDWRTRATIPPPRSGEP